MHGGIGVEGDDDAVGDALLRLTDQEPPRAGDGFPHDPSHLVAADVVAHPVELEAARPWFRIGGPRRWVLPLAGERAGVDRPRGGGGPPPRGAAQPRAVPGPAR